MSSVSKEQIAQAREADLLAYLLTYEPGSVKKAGVNYRHTEHDSLVYVAKKNYWYWNSRGRRINALDYLTEIRGYHLVDAVNRLIGSGPAVYPARSAAALQEEKPKPFRLPWTRRCATYMVSYLQRRGIDSEVISRCIQKGLLYESQYNGKEVCVFVGRDDTGNARFACVRGIEENLKKDVGGSDKRFSFCYPPDRPGSRQAAVFESPIDALSHATLQKLEGWKWNGHRLSLGGTSPVALTAFLERRPEIKRVVLHMDSDLAGLTNARKIKAALRANKRFRHIRVSVNPARGGKDYNERLQGVIEERKQQRSRQRAAIVI